MYISQAVWSVQFFAVGSLTGICQVFSFSRGKITAIVFADGFPVLPKRLSIFYCEALQAVQSVPSLWNYWRNLRERVHQIPILAAGECCFIIFWA